MANSGRELTRSDNTFLVQCSMLTDDHVVCRPRFRSLKTVMYMPNPDVTSQSSSFRHKFDLHNNYFTESALLLLNWSNWQTLPNRRIEGESAATHRIYSLHDIPCYTVALV